mmetsp:Transcript_32060/g.76521  ORF Transcript_32060/g.76521 Transcript_32060/m.76521 type:complete len:217 (+) Transcript_32060:1064-1714(+)
MTLNDLASLAACLASAVSWSSFRARASACLTASSLASSWKPRSSSIIFAASACRAACQASLLFPKASAHCPAVYLPPSAPNLRSSKCSASCHFFSPRRAPNLARNSCSVFMRLFSGGGKGLRSSGFFAAASRYSAFPAGVVVGEGSTSDRSAGYSIFTSWLISTGATQSASSHFLLASLDSPYLSSHCFRVYFFFPSRDNFRASKVAARCHFCCQL